jgi:hypothetical protein
MLSARESAKSLSSQNQAAAQLGMLSSLAALMLRVGRPKQRRQAIQIRHRDVDRGTVKIAD